MPQYAKFSLQQLMILMLSFLILIIFFPIAGSIDLALIHPWIGSHGEFYLKNNWYLDQLAHQDLKHVIIGFYSILFILWLLSFKLNRLKPKRYAFGYFFFVSMLCTIAIGILKAHSSHGCPWDMTSPSPSGFIWDFVVQNGHCFPGGHASCGFALMTGYFVYRQHQPRYAYFYLLIGFILGFAMGWTQMMRGAHFLSHNLWTLWIIWLINVVVYYITQSFYLRRHHLQIAVK
ncbi:MULTISPECIES: phosphatase PAP2 family protein [unclassified Acinetobacter]|uniref:phosphatase PAP2 family protein n=1 Tax=unclassified Acinetobacter TaxID=196816 RepID=UPI002934D7C2|nr:MULTISPECIES: phosphatase PAP2 family protein [unclassified Acinetobacter]WOE32872.1 phosphatase PAP2 family protein [Acinetobacter sp. SAAs470]WOE38349.1 phosphatase PAP2 family protein [Acinetobacter sp. SAAs474]